MQSSETKAFTCERCTRELRLLAVSKRRDGVDAHNALPYGVEEHDILAYTVNDLVTRRGFKKTIAYGLTRVYCPHLNALQIALIGASR